MHFDHDMKRSLILTSFLTAALASAAYAENPRADKPTGKPVTIKMMDQEGRSIGTATMNSSANGVAFKLDLKNVPPGSHALALHESGKCEAPNFKSANNELSPSSANQRAGSAATGPASSGESPSGTGAPSGATSAPGSVSELALQDITADVKGTVRTTIKLANPAARAS